VSTPNRPWRVTYIGRRARTFTTADAAADAMRDARDRPVDGARLEHDTWPGVYAVMAGHGAALRVRADRGHVRDLRGFFSYLNDRLCCYDVMRVDSEEASEVRMARPR
jgi:hypothetical protein